MSVSRSSCAGERLADVVDDRQLGGPLAGLVEEARVLERHAQARREGAQEAGVGLAEGVRLQALEGHHAEDPFAGEDGHPEPGLGPEAQP